MFPSADAIAERLSGLVDGTGNMWRAHKTLLLVPHAAGWPVRVVVADDVVRLFTGMGSHFPIAIDDAATLDPLLSVVVAIQLGHAEEYFGEGTGGSLVPVGSRVWYPTGSLEQLDRGVLVEATVRATAWNGTP